MVSIGIWLALKGFMGVGRVAVYFPFGSISLLLCFPFSLSWYNFERLIDLQLKQELRHKPCSKDVKVIINQEKFFMIDQLLEGNKKFRETVFKQNFDHYQELTKGQSPPVLWIGCSDSRLQTGHITQMKPGHLFVQRNIGNVAPIHDWNFATVLEYAIKHLKVKDIVICGHSDCGAIKALDKELDDVYIPLWLNNAIEAKNRVDSKIKKPTTPEETKKRSRMIEQENVRLQIEHLKTYPLIKTALKEKLIEVHGLYYDLENGALTKIV
jgi:carbonic anhydrase